MKPHNNKRTMKPIRPLRPARGNKNTNSEHTSDQQQHNKTKQTIRLPTNHRTLIKAAIIGKQGSQIKLISELSQGCRIKVEESRVVIYAANNNQKVAGNDSLSSSGNNLQIAVNLVQSIINNVLCVFEHPNVICSIYECNGEEERMKLTRFETPIVLVSNNHNDDDKEEGEQREKVKHHQNYYRLALASDDNDELADEEVKDLQSTIPSSSSSMEFSNNGSSASHEEQLLSNSSSNGGDKTSDTSSSSSSSLLVEKRLVKSDHQLYSQRKERQLISEGLSSAVSNYLKLDQFEGMERKLLIKVGLGRKVFYDAKRNVEMTSSILNRVYNFESFSKLDIGYGKDLKSSFRLEMGGDFALNLKEYLLKNNWKHTETIKSATCYVVKLMQGIMGSAGGKRMSFKVVPNGSLAKIGKLKIALDKLSYLDFCNLEENCPDLRLRFETEQYSRESTDEEFNKFISALKFNEKDQVDMSGVPQELLDIFRIDSVRNKVKEIYCLNDLKITINKILSNGRGWYEISMSSLQPYNELSSSEDVVNVLSTMRSVLNGVCGPRIHCPIISNIENVNTTTKKETKTSAKPSKDSTPYWTVLGVAAFCAAVGFGLNKLIHK
ncbi:predicted protein [Naegleria gruberi]|uniref:Predicted protein n=1 Tax=Naegleria gruberi TaxID=5762 RepID=D2VCG4_NAEGR|nr:uncharacterized protein NAEGRDRAFT_66562 [Naegleria gruberi]EFC45303.1 predicted protein [Naegleria gruberi]|eukprot:XP_002678047.1 predicted protein [Naegleria gruberi strain NEG-M]